MQELSHNLLLHFKKSIYHCSAFKQRGRNDTSEETSQSSLQRGNKQPAQIKLTSPWRIKYEIKNGQWHY